VRSQVTTNPSSTSRPPTEPKKEDSPLPAAPWRRCRVSGFWLVEQAGEPPAQPVLARPKTRANMGEEQSRGDLMPWFHALRVKSRQAYRERGCTRQSLQPATRHGLLAILGIVLAS